MTTDVGTRKILYSPGFGAGWTTWNSGETAKFMLTYQPIIEWLEANGNDGIPEDHELIKRLQAECLEKFGEDYVCVLGARDLRVATVRGRVLVNEYDGSESIREEGDEDGWM